MSVEMNGVRMRANGVKALYVRLAVICVITLPALTACAKNTVPVSVHGVNYAADEFSYVIEDPSNNKNTAGGETIGPFAAGGTMCCYDLPTKWRSGIQIKISATHWQKVKPDGSLPEVSETKVVEVPQYLNGKAGELWVLRAADGQLSLVSSDFQPDHPKWPGKLKGWPVPSLTYQRERWDISIHTEQTYFDAYTGLLKEMSDNPVKAAADSWAHAKKYDPQSLVAFSGPQDPAYHSYLIKDYKTSLAQVQKKLKELKEHRP
ncbi:MAG: DUF3304 domain-containing protein [Pseudomonadota bacterium]